MLLKDRLIAHGAFLFRWRSFLPLIVALPILMALPQSGFMERWLGEGWEEAWDVFCVLLAFAGLGIRVATVGCAPAGTSGRNTRSQRAEALNTTGLYSIVRNPLYLGNTITILGLVLLVKVWWLVAVVAPVMLLYYERIVYAEEGYLQDRFGAAYRAWASRTPAFIPDLRLWRRPELPFSVRTALRREYHGFFAIVAATVLIEASTDVIGEHERVGQWLHQDLAWLLFFLAGAVVYLTVRLVRKWTSWLNVQGR